MSTTNNQAESGIESGMRRRPVVSSSLATSVCTAGFLSGSLFAMLSLLVAGWRDRVKQRQERQPEPALRRVDLSRCQGIDCCV